MKNIDLVILAGGKGTRIKKLTNYPKPIVKFNNLHFLDYLIQSYGIYNFKYPSVIISAFINGSCGKTYSISKSSNLFS